MAQEHVPTFDDINWFYGIFGERPGVEPNLMFRPKGMPAPFGIWIFDALLLYGFDLPGSPSSRCATRLKNRKVLGIMKGHGRGRAHEGATPKSQPRRVRREALAHRRRGGAGAEPEMRESAEIERARILDEARARRQRMEQDAKQLVAQELAAARETP